jgi:succinate dehydrogenase / fumarate reductase cytochrome b subunit
MSEVSAAVKSSIGSKVIMALTGLGLILFVIVHMAGNLQMFAGQEAMNNYAVALRKVPLLLWIARLGIIGFFVFHVFDGLRLKLKNRAARPVAYVSKNTVKATLASRTMAISGAIILAFLVYHLLHFTLGVTHPEHFALKDAQGRQDVFNMVVYGFQNALVSGGYILAMVLLFAHLSHGAASWLQSLGWNHPKINGIVKIAAPAITWLVCLGFISVPLGVLLGIIEPFKPTP